MFSTMGRSLLLVRPYIRISLAAGARSVLVALWDIDDKATMLFLKRLYQDLKRR